MGARPTIALKIGPKRMMRTASEVIPRFVLKVAPRVVLKVAPKFALEAGPTTAPRFVPGVGPTVMRRPLPIRNSMLPVRKTSPVL